MLSNVNLPAVVTSKSIYSAATETITASSQVTAHEVQCKSHSWIITLLSGKAQRLWDEKLRNLHTLNTSEVHMYHFWIISNKCQYIDQIVKKYASKSKYTRELSIEMLFVIHVFTSQKRRLSAAVSLSSSWFLLCKKCSCWCRKKKSSSSLRSEQVTPWMSINMVHWIG